MERVYYKLYDYSLFVPDFEEDYEERVIEEPEEVFDRCNFIEGKPIHGSYKIIKEEKKNEV